MRIQYVEKERADKSNRVELKEVQIKVISAIVEKFINEIHVHTGCGLLWCKDTTL